VVSRIASHVALVGNQTVHSVKRIHTDSGSEFVNSHMHKLCAEQGIRHTVCTSRTAPVERSRRAHEPHADRKDTHTVAQCTCTHMAVGRRHDNGRLHTQPHTASQRRRRTA